MAAAKKPHAAKTAHKPGKPAKVVQKPGKPAGKADLPLDAPLLRPQEPAGKTPPGKPPKQTPPEKPAKSAAPKKAARLAAPPDARDVDAASGRVRKRRDAPRVSRRG